MEVMMSRWAWCNWEFSTHTPDQVEAESRGRPLWAFGQKAGGDEV